MTRLTWDSRQSLHESGIDKCVLYLGTSFGVAWNGVTSIDENEVESAQSTIFLDGVARTIFEQGGNYSANLSAYFYPDEFLEYDGFDSYLENQTKKRFGLSYRVNYGEGYKIHLVYNAIATPSGKSWDTLSDKLSSSEFSWLINTSAKDILGAKPSAHLVIDATNARYPDAIAALEDILYGTDELPARLPDPNEIIDIFESYVTLRITYHGDGTWSAIGPDDMVSLVADGQFQISSPSAIYYNSDVYRISSY